MIAISVGPARYRFSFHQIKVYGRSKWFKDACSTRLTAGQPEQDLEFHLPNVKIEGFQLYWEWIYSGNICLSRCTKGSETKDKTAEYSMIINLYLLGFTIADIQLRNVAIREITRSLSACNLLPDQVQVAAIWAATEDGDCLRKPVIDYVVSRAKREGVARALALYPSACVQELALAALHRAPITAWQPAFTEGSPYLAPEVDIN
jgi:hypothetical protein